MLSTTAAAVPFDTARIGDVDGFGFGDGAGLTNFEGDPVNVDASGALGPGDFLPDLNGDGLVMHFQGDDFDNRSAAERGGSSLTGSGFTDIASTGSQFTDLALSQSYDTTFNPDDFPDPPSTDRNDASFTFDFFVDEDDITFGSPIFFNIVYGDIGLVPGDLTLTFADGSTRTITLSPINPSEEDGRIQGAFVELDFLDVFTPSGGGFTGSLEVDLITRPETVDGDPFYAVDFTELSTRQIGTELPAPGTLILLAAGLAGLALRPVWLGPRGGGGKSH